ncbi:cytochrome C assembly family protein [Zhongshania borealis]|jgi:ABC-type uncharacterized transport system permease subunit|uniref:Inner membrane protein YpjD n=1 Tax=Zhongshania borealis TaxID=889488 RepID=A0ABP7WGE7_9GAMM|tara:strand:+ start:1202 stop:1987 length:786 start_codon:yes stop_codon:yes gene_type:complete
MNAYSSIAAITLYFIAASTQYRLINSPLSYRSLVPGLLATLCHAVAAFTAISTPAGMDLGVIQVLSLITWLICVITLSASLRRPLHNLLIALYPLAAISVAAELLIPGKQQFLQHQSPGMLSHILLSILAYSMITIAALQAIVLALQNSMLRDHRVKGLPSILPPLQTMEAMLFELIWAGFILLTLAIVTGGLYVGDILAQHLLHKTVFTVLSWIMLAILLWGRAALGWRGKIAIRWTLWAFAFLILAYLGTKFALSLVTH